MIRSVPAVWLEPTSTTSPMPCAINSTLRRMKARIRISLSSLSACTSASICSRLSSISSPGWLARMRTSDRRPDIMLTSPVNWPGPCLVTRISVRPEGCTISSSPAFTTKNGTPESPCSTSTSAGRICRTRPCAEMRAICAEVSVGNMCSTREPIGGAGEVVSAISKRW